MGGARPAPCHGSCARTNCWPLRPLGRRAAAAAGRVRRPGLWGGGVGRGERWPPSDRQKDVVCCPARCGYLRAVLPSEVGVPMPRGGRGIGPPLSPGSCAQTHRGPLRLSGRRSAAADATFVGVLGGGGGLDVTRAAQRHSPSTSRWPPCPLRQGAGGVSVGGCGGQRAWRGGGPNGC